MVIVNSTLLDTFEKVSELKTVHAAAESLGLTQAAVTKRIQALERDLKISVFLRSRRGMTLTAEGKALLQYSKTTKEAEGLLLSQISGAERSEVALTIAGPTSVIATRVPKCIDFLYEKYPFLRLHLLSDDHSNLIELVRRGAADLALVPPEIVPNEMESKVLKPEQYCLVGPAKWRGRDLIDILENERVIDFYEADMTTTNYLKKFNLHKHLKRPRLYVNENEALIHLFASGVGFGTLTESVAKPYLENRTLVRLNRGQIMEDPLAVVWYSRSRKMNYFDDLIRSLK